MGGLESFCKKRIRVEETYLLGLFWVPFYLLSVSSLSFHISVCQAEEWRRWFSCYPETKAAQNKGNVFYDKVWRSG